jgi:hypothetical protein
MTLDEDGLKVLALDSSSSSSSEESEQQAIKGKKKEDYKPTGVSFSDL